MKKNRHHSKRKQATTTRYNKYKKNSTSDTAAKKELASNKKPGSVECLCCGIFFTRINQHIKSSQRCSDHYKQLKHSKQPGVDSLHKSVSPLQNSNTVSSVAPYHSCNTNTNVTKNAIAGKKSPSSSEHIDINQLGSRDYQIVHNSNSLSSIPEGERKLDQSPHLTLTNSNLDISTQTKNNLDEDNILVLHDVDDVLDTFDPSIDSMTRPQPITKISSMPTDAIFDPDYTSSAKQQFTVTTVQTSSNNSDQSQMHDPNALNFPSHVLDISDITHKMSTLRNNPSFTNKELCSLRLYQILDRANAPISLYNELIDFITSVVPLFEGKHSTSYFLTRNDLVKKMHELVFNGSKNSNKNKRNKSNSKNEFAQQPNQSLDSDHRSLDKCNTQTSTTSSQLVRDTNTSSARPHIAFSLEPKIQRMRLSEDNEGLEVEITTFDFLSNVISLLNDPMLMKQTNTLYHREEYMNPQNFKEDFKRYDDIHTANWYLQTHSKMISDKCTQILCPLIFFIDGVAIDTYGKKSLEPVSFTLGIFNRNTRNKASAWRVLGYIPNIEKTNKVNYKSSKQGSDEKRLHYHRMLSVILNGLETYQSKDGIITTLPFWTSSEDREPEYRRVQMKFPIMFIIGDCIGNDKLCSRLHTYVPNRLANNGVCRDCNVWYEHASAHDFQCKPVSRACLTKLVPNVLKRLGFHVNNENAFTRLCLGAISNGINGSTPPETLHQWYLGIVTFVVEYFLDRLTSKTKSLLDEMIRDCSNNYSRQSDISFPSISSFKIGIDKVKLTGKERENQLFAIHLAMLPQNNKALLVNSERSSQNKFRIRREKHSNGSTRTKRIKLQKILDTNDKFNKWLDLFESMLSISEWMCHPSVGIPKGDIEPSIRVKMKTIPEYEKWMKNNYENNLNNDSNNDCIVSDDESIDCANVEETDNTNVFPLSDVLIGQNYLNENNVTVDVYDGDPNEENGDILFNIDIDEEEIEQDNTIEDVDEEVIMEDENYQHSIDVFNKTESTSTNMHNNVKSHDNDRNSTNNRKRKRTKVSSDTSKDIDSKEKCINPLYYGNNKYMEIKTKEVIISKAEYGLRVFLQKLKSCITKEDQHRLKSVKIHQLIHYPLYIFKYGSPSNFSGSVSESHGKETAKKVGQRTQQRNETINHQAAKRFSENVIIRQAVHLLLMKKGIISNKLMKMLISNSDATESIVKDDEQIHQSQDNTYFSFAYGTKSWCISTTRQYNSSRTQESRRLSEINVSEVCDRASSSTKSHTSIHQQDIMKLFCDSIMRSGISKQCQQKICSVLSNLRINTFNRVNWKGISYRCAFEYHGENAWFDWMSIDWGEQYGMLPGKLLCLIDGDTLLKSLLIEIACDGLKLEMKEHLPDCKVWCMVQTSGHKKVSPASYTSKLSSIYAMEREVRLIGLESVNGPCFVIPNTRISNDKNFVPNNEKCSQREIAEEIIHIHDRNVWSRKFLEDESRTPTFKPIQS